jgi:hypothetical protein
MNNLMKVILIPLILIHLNAFGQFKSLTGIHDSVNISLIKFVEKAGFGKIRYYYDDLNHKDGIWDLYPSLQITDNLYAVNISTIPGRISEYTFIIFVNITSKFVNDTLGPFYDTGVDAMEIKLENNQIVQMKVRLNNLPEQEESKYIIIEYSRVKSSLKETKSYNQD